MDQTHTRWKDKNIATLVHMAIPSLQMGKVSVFRQTMERMYQALVVPVFGLLDPVVFVRHVCRVTVVIAQILLLPMAMSVRRVSCVSIQ